MYDLKMAHGNHHPHVAQLLSLAAKRAAVVLAYPREGTCRAPPLRKVQRTGKQASHPPIVEMHRADGACIEVEKTKELPDPVPIVKYG